MEPWLYDYQKKIFRRNITWDKEGHFIFIKATSFQTDTIILNEYPPSNIITPKYMNQNLSGLKKKRDKS